ncbi:Protein FAM8A1 [Varanus komodoensis]|uniref:Family with sequence similarity 8 member A1 n=1 Tax=Varanus komodoensis TaxID=61221 RepID=A0A8D2L217_VARKO|nr:protein FAM8A1 [Varanus komodoensis]KAF7245283.1 Protein FAM8A1 [Varanus komodoensis]
MEELREVQSNGDGGGPGEGGTAAAAGSEALSAGEYSRRVHQWLWDSYCGYLSWQSGLAALMAGAATAAASASGPAPGGYYYGSSPCYYFFATPPAPSAEAGPVPSRAASAWQPPTGRQAPLAQRAGPAPSSSQRESGRPAGREYIIPSLAHRFMAEMVDFFILFFIKATIVLSIMHLSGIKDISKFAMHYIIEEIDEDTSMEDLQKMMIVALVYRLLVCFYEIICIWGAGGATPGKFLLGLRVVTCDTSVLIAPSRVLVIPSSKVSMTTSTIRALIKNFSIASFFPAFITLLFFHHNRTAYDIVAGTIVVKRHNVR